ncbi:hypothetical protein Bca52824_026290 [Brassica carinata]|uniref:B box-type domain-containing protein n=1 Tax=Brassica carinata TaxID=52824 RepID=A0A8X7V8Z3_BRACI|nr:hypothetical protein Bca52824_026290 [Brassica carinata]
MCKGVNEEENRSVHRGCWSLCTRPNVPVRYELCGGGDASVFCEADSAFLCRKCDRWVHGANFLLTRRCLVGDNYHVVLPSATARESTMEDITKLSEQDISNNEVQTFV